MSKAIALSGGMKLPAKLQKQLEQEALAESSREVSSGGRFISTAGDKFSFQGNKLPNPMEVVIADYLCVNEYYDAPFNADVPSSPACWAIGKDEKSLAPSPLAPRKQAATCAECEFNKFGSSETGKGKMCKNTRRVAVFPMDAIKAGEHAMLKISPTGLQGWKKYIDQLTKVARVPTYAVITEMTLEDKTVKPSLVRGLPAKTISTVSALRDTVQSDLLADFNPSTESAAPKGGNKRVKVNKKGRK